MLKLYGEVAVALLIANADQDANLLPITSTRLRSSTLSRHVLPREGSIGLPFMHAVVVKRSASPASAAVLREELAQLGWKNATFELSSDLRLGPGTSICGGSVASAPDIIVRQLRAVAALATR